ncbi:MAG: transglycosylase SLT domain-containing protein [Myxococcales bacterium]|nr:transglycosylase SLT domain-containing protein [Myxococcales bacterium]
MPLLMSARRLALLFAALLLCPSAVLAAPAMLTVESVASRFTGPLAPVAEAIDRDDAAAARMLINDIDVAASAPARVLRARLFDLEGKFLDAAEAFWALRKDFPKLADHWAFEAGTRFARARLWDRALEAFGAIASSSRLFDRAQLERSKILEEKGALEEARAALAQLIRRREPAEGNDLGAEALTRHAQLSVRLKDSAGERSALMALWRDHPRAPFAEEARSALGVEAFALEDRVARAEKLVAAHHNQRAIAELTPLIERLEFPSALGCRAHLALGEALRKERLHERAIEIFSPIVEACPAQKSQALYSLASSQSIAHPERGAAFYDRFIEAFPGSRNRAQAEWFAAALEIQNELIDTASARLERLARDFPKSRYAPEALFKRFWIDWQAGKIADADAWLDLILRAPSTKANDRQRALYWKARIVDRRGKTRDAQKMDERLAREAPTTYYGAMALGRLERSNPAQACATRTDIAAAIRGDSKGRTASEDVLAQLPLKLGALQKNARLDVAIEFLRLGMMDAAREELSALARHKQSQEDRKVLAVLMGLAGDFRGAQWIARVHFASVFEKSPTPGTRGLWTLAWPRAHRALIEQHCATHGVRPDLLQALMREESALDPKARSWAGALGLTQLMPDRAREVSRLVGRASFKDDDLFEPSTSIEFGCAWLGTLLREFEGEPLFAFAAYNADTARVRQWQSVVSEGDLDRFVEQIPIAETRGYVKRLVRSETIYRWLYQAQSEFQKGCPQE